MSWAACCANKQMQDMFFGESSNMMYRDAAKGRREASCQVRHAYATFVSLGIFFYVRRSAREFDRKESMRCDLSYVLELSV